MAVMRNDGDPPGSVVRPFTGKVVLITGASEGIGRALALELSGDAPRLVLVARSAARLASLGAECRALGASVIAVPTDLTDPSAGRKLIEAALREFSRLDVLVNNAGATMWGRFDELEDLTIIEHLVRLNYLASAWLTAAALPALKDSGGLIVAVASVAGLTGVPERTGYAASKHAMIGFFDSLRIELAGTGVDVTIVAPDFVRTEIHRRAIGPTGAPLGVTPMRENRIMTAASCAKRIRHAMEHRKRLQLTSLRGHAGRWLKLLSPSLVDRIAARAIRERH